LISKFKVKNCFFFRRGTLNACKSSDFNKDSRIEKIYFIGFNNFETLELNYEKDITNM